MRYFICIVVIIFMFIGISSNKCITSSSTGVTSVVIHSMKEMEKSDPKNFLNHLQENLQEIRENFESGKLPSNETIHYYFFTLRNPEKPYSLTNSVESLKNSYYSYKDPLVMVIHGYQNKLSLREGMFYKLKNALLKQGNRNVVFIDYTAINQGAFLDAIKKSFIVAKELADFLKFLKDRAGTPLERMHLISVSLGAQIAGNAGHKLQGIGRITALDAAGDVFYSFPNDLKLDRNDANFVDVIHTADASPFPEGLGYYDPIGHLDFYPNGGRHQPGCEEVPTNSSMSAKLKVALHTVCMHLKAGEYYLESVCNNRCPFIGVMCESYEKFERGLCTPLNSMMALMGQPATKPPRDLPRNEMFFLNTNANYPFCKLQQP